MPAHDDETDAMKAAWYEANGTARDVLRVGEMEAPKPGDGEVRVRIGASGINPSDVKTRAGISRKIAFPRVVPHCDGAGEIDAVGPGVPRSRIGERVWMWNAQWQRPFGTAAEHCVVPARQAVPLPANVPFEEGACLGVPALTAWHAVMLDGAAAVSGETVLIPGGAGGVGHYAIQFAKAAGAEVITTISSPEKAAHARAAGADHTIDYKTEDVGGRVKEITGGRGVARVIEIDLVRNAALLPGVLAPRGTVVVYGTGGGEATIPSGFLLGNTITLAFFLVYTLTDDELRRAINAVTTALTHGRLLNAVADTWPLDQIVAAHETVEAGRLMGTGVIRV